MENSTRGIGVQNKKNVRLSSIVTFVWCFLSFAVFVLVLPVDHWLHGACLIRFNPFTKNFMGLTKIASLPAGQVTAGHLRDASFCGCVSFVVGYFPDFFPKKSSYLMASGVGVIGHFPTLQCKKHFRKNKFWTNSSIPQICSQGIHTFGLACIWLLITDRKASNHNQNHVTLLTSLMM